MRRVNKQKPPNAFAWFARYIADQRQTEGRPFRSIKAALHEAAIQWEKLTPQDKADWKEKAHSERLRFRTDPDLRTMTPKEFIGQGCELSANGMTGDQAFWSRHWTSNDRDQYADELDFLENFDTKKRKHDREMMLTSWAWMYNDNTDGLMQESFIFISVQSSSPVEADNYVPERMAMVQFSVKEGIVPYSEFCCSLASEHEWQVSRRTGTGHSEFNVGDEDGCQARVGMQAVAKLLFQRVKLDQLESGTVRIPTFFCLAEEFEVVYDALCELNIRASKWMGGSRRLSVHSVGTIEDLAYCLMKMRKMPMLDCIGQSEEQQEQFYLDTLMERSDPRMVAIFRCSAHDSETMVRCPQSVVRMAAMKIKQWMDAGGIPDEDLPLIERQLLRQQDWPTFSDPGQGEEREIEISDEEGDEESGGGKGQRSVPIGRHERTLAWIEEQKKMVGAAVMQEGEPEPECGMDESGNHDIQFGPCLPENQSNDETLVEERVTVDETKKGFQRGFGRGGNFQMGQYSRLGVPGITAQGQLLEELEVQSKLPLGSRGIGRGLHFVPSYVSEFQALQRVLNK